MAADGGVVDCQHLVIIICNLQISLHNSGTDVAVFVISYYLILQLGRGIDFVWLDMLQRRH